MKSIVTAAWDQEDGAMAIEYAILAASIAAVIAATVIAVGEKLPTMFSAVSTAWP